MVFSVSILDRCFELRTDGVSLCFNGQGKNMSETPKTVTWTEFDAELPEIAARVFALRGRTVHASLDPQGLEYVLGTLIAIHAVSGAQYEKLKDGIISRVVDNEWSASNGGKDPKAEKGERKKLSNPENPQAVLDAVGNSFLTWAATALEDELFKNRLREANELLEEHGRGHYAEFLMESFEDFKTHFMARIMPVYDKDYIDFWPKVDRWFADNVKSGNMELLAIFYDRGAGKALEVMHNLAPAASPHI